MTSYRGNPPSLTLGRGELEGFVEVIKKHTTNPSVEISVSEGGYTHNYSSVDSLIDDSSLPDHILEYRIEVRGEEGSVNVRYNSKNGYSTHSYSIRGDDDWVKTKKSDLENYFSHQRNFIRTLFEKDRWAFAGSMVLSVMAASVAYVLSTPKVSFYTFLGSFNLYWFAGLFGMNRIYPYSVLQISDIKYNYKFQKALKAIATLVGVVAGAITIFRYLF